MPVNFLFHRQMGPRQQGPTAGLGISPGLDPGEYQSLALLNALSQVQESGLQRHAGPMGSIAGGLAPLVQALIQAKGMQAQAQMQQQVIQEQRAKTQSEIIKNLAQAQRAEKGRQPQTFQSAMLQAFDEGNMDKVKQIASMATQVAKPPGGEIGLLREANPNASPQDLLDKLVTQKRAEAGATVTGRLEATPKKPLTPGQVDEFTDGIALIKSFDKVTANLDKTTPLNILSNTLHSGLMSNEATQAYNRVFNDIDNFRAKARGMTKVALDRVKSEVPPMEMMLYDPDKFSRLWKAMRSDWYDVVATRVAATGKRQDVDQSITSQIAALAPQGKIQPSNVDVDPSAMGDMKARLQDLKKRGYTREEAKTMLLKGQLGIGGAGQVPVGVPAEADPEDAND